MCGIVGYVGHQDVVPWLLDGLRRLEYRGYDSAGVVVPGESELKTVRAAGKLDRLVERLDGQELGGTIGLGHTRWATHGAPIEKNAHPIVDEHGRVAVIHNGIIENFLVLRKRLESEGWTFRTDTDTEVIANLISSRIELGLGRAVRLAIEELEGMYAIGVLSTASEEPELYAVRQGPPLVLGRGEGEQFLASDPSALLASTRDVIFLENGDRARITAGSIEIKHGEEIVERPVTRLTWDPIQAEKGGYKHFMLKEIHDQPQAIQDTFAGRVDFSKSRVAFDSLDLTKDDLKKIRRIHLLACGTSWHAALVGKFFIEELVGIPVEVDYGSEYRYRDPIVGADVLAIGISQSGETLDTVSAMEVAKERGARLLTICNVVGSQATRLSDGVIYTHAGPEIGVASSKAFTTQLIALYLLALYLRQQREGEFAPELLAELAHLPQAVDAVLRQESAIEELTRKYFRVEDFLYLGRGVNYPIALEGALKLKEISYIHAEGYPAGEMKHGPIALIDEDVPVVAIATGDRVYRKVRGNVREVKARDGAVIVVTDRSEEEFEGLADDVLSVPRVSELLQPIVNTIPLQLFAYFVAVRRGADVDQPRNLAKSVTVE